MRDSTVPRGRELTPRDVAEMYAADPWETFEEEYRRRSAELDAGGALTPEEERYVEAVERWRERFLNGELSTEGQWSQDLLVAFNPPANLRRLSERCLDRMARRLCDRWKVVRGTRRWVALCERTREAQENQPGISRGEMKVRAARAGLAEAYRDLDEEQHIRLSAPLGPLPQWLAEVWRTGSWIVDATGRKTPVRPNSFPSPVALAVFVPRAVGNAERYLLERPRSSTDALDPEGRKSAPQDPLEPFDDERHQSADCDALEQLGSPDADSLGTLTGRATFAATSDARQQVRQVLDRATPREREIILAMQDEIQQAAPETPIRGTIARAARRLDMAPGSARVCLFRFRERVPDPR